MTDKDLPLKVVADRIDRVILQSRLNSIGFMMLTDRDERLAQIAAVITKLRSGMYLIGTGPSTVGIVPLTVDEVVLGRAATPLEEPTEIVVDYQVADTIYLGPHEVSRTHAKIVRQRGSNGAEYRIVDLGSRCGTFVNGDAVETDGRGRVLSPGDLISLGSTQVSTYVFVSVK